MEKEINLGWKTDRKDLVDAVRAMPSPQISKLLAKFMKGDPRAKGIRSFRQEQQANLLMLGLLEGKVPESTVLTCSP